MSFTAEKISSISAAVRSVASDPPGLVRFPFPSKGKVPALESVQGALLSARPFSSRNTMTLTSMVVTRPGDGEGEGDGEGDGDEVPPPQIRILPADPLPEAELKFALPEPPLQQPPGRSLLDDAPWYGKPSAAAARAQSLSPSFDVPMGQEFEPSLPRTKDGATPQIGALLEAARPEAGLKFTLPEPPFQQPPGRSLLEEAPLYGNPSAAAARMHSLSSSLDDPLGHEFVLSFPMTKEFSLDAVCQVALS